MGTPSDRITALKARYGVDWPGVFANETPQLQIRVDSFRLDAYEVSNAAYAEFVAANPEWEKDALPPAEHNGDYLAHWSNGRPAEEDLGRPVVYVTWSSALAYCQWRSGRLPTEAEWEYAARSGDDREFPWGDELPTPAKANFSDSNIGAPVDVGSYPANEFGVHDLAGNVWEFLADEWQENYRPSPTVSTAGALDQGSRRSVRGASFGGSTINLRTRWRDSHVVSNAIEFVGFRCAYDD
jgi:formylglycine-generating enzyme required for sulfatase activity